MKRISQHDIFTLVSIKPHEELASIQKYSSFQPGMYVACVYDSRWYIGYITERSEENQDVEVQYMNRKDTTVSWPVDTRRERSWIPLHDVIMLIEAPLLQGQTGRMYKTVEADYIRIRSLLPNFIS